MSTNPAPKTWNSALKSCPSRVFWSCLGKTSTGAEARFLLWFLTRR
jgi:hypothetical protein